MQNVRSRRGMAIRPRDERQRGQAIAELALVVPILLLILLGLLQFAFILGAQIGITNAVREASRTAASFKTLNDTQATANGDWTYAQLTGPTGMLSTYVQGYKPTRLVTSGAPLTSVCYTTYTDPATTTQAKIKVEAIYSHPLFLPIISTILDGFDGANDGGFRLSAAEEIRVENPAGTVPVFAPNPHCET